MKKFNLSVAAVLAMSTFVLAGGDIEPVMEPVVETPAPVVVVEPSHAGSYLGLGYSYMNFNAQEVGGPDEFDIDGNAITLIAGYNFNQYMAVEGRYSVTVGDLSVSTNYGVNGDIDATMDNIAIYLKPMLPMGEITLYGLLGYGEVGFEFEGSKGTESGFQWGAGASFAFDDRAGLFVDYTRIYEDTVGDADFVMDSINVGLTYKF